MESSVSHSSTPKHCSFAAIKEQCKREEDGLVLKREMNELSRSLRDYLVSGEFLEIDLDLVKSCDEVAIRRAHAVSDFSMHRNERGSEEL